MTSESDDPLSTPSNASTVSAMFLEADGFWDDEWCLQKCIFSKVISGKIAQPEFQAAEQAALGEDVSLKDLRVLELVKYGMPINCDQSFGVKKQQKNHFSATAHKSAINEYLRN